MTIIERHKVQAAVERALQLHPDRDAAVSATATALCLPHEAVLDAIEPDPVDSEGGELDLVS